MRKDGGRGVGTSNFIRFFSECRNSLLELHKRKRFTTSTVSRNLLLVKCKNCKKSKHYNYSLKANRHLCPGFVSISHAK